MLDSKTVATVIDALKKRDISISPDNICNMGVAPQIGDQQVDYRVLSLQIGNLTILVWIYPDKASDVMIIQKN